VKHCQTLEVGKDRSIVVGNDEDNLVKENRELTVDVNDSVVIGGNHDKTITGRVLQVYGGDHARKVDGDQDLVEEQNKDEHVKQAYVLTTDKKFQLVQDTTSMTFRGTNVMLNSGGEITVMAGGAVVSVDKKGTATFSSPAGIKLVCGASSLAILPGGIALASPALTAAAGGASKLGMGEEAVEISSRKVTIAAGGVCKIRGKKALKLQESQASKGKRKGKGKGGGESDAAESAREAAIYDERLQLVDQTTGEPLADCPYVILRDDQLVARGRTDENGMTIRVESGNSEAEMTMLWGEDALEWR
jgi:hypothetical protein